MDPIEETREPRRPKFARSRSERLLFGVCSGLARTYRWEILWVRLAFVLATFFGGLGALVYLILVLLVPQEDAPEASPREVAQEGFRELRTTAAELGTRVSVHFQRDRPTGGARRGHRVIGILVIGVGILWLLDNLGFPWPWRLGAHVLWPIGLILAGLILFAGHLRGGKS